MIEVEQIAFSYGDRTVLEDLSFRVEEKEKVVLLGVNGSGKSTLLKILDGLLFPERGRVTYRGDPLTRKLLRRKGFNRRFRSEVVLLFQNPDMMIFNPTVFDEIAFGPRQLGMEDIEDRVRHWADRLGLSRYLDRPPFNLSGGEKQKVCLASLLAVEPATLLLDEPTSSLDPRSTGRLIDFLSELDLTTLITTHNLSLAQELGTRCLILSEEHRLIYDGELAPFLNDMEKLIEANLVHSHRHAHGPVDHEHFHLHQWD
ncbi:MAG: ABC transporter ATP-binding protein [Deltaproteobacteria bacterium]|nr:ABC transporter ATP-binding protein [Deltaproteobacteria bacterium]